MTDEHTADANEEQKKSSSSKSSTSEKPTRTRSRSRTSQPQTTVAASDTSPEAAPDGSDSMERADLLVAEWGARAQKVGKEIGHQLIRVGARAREEAEDIWAEAQGLRRTWVGEHSEDQQA
jgi:hypothetical protein